MTPTRAFPRLHVFMGAGGVGKTTLSASTALALAARGRSVGLLSIDPAKRLQGALSAGPLDELGTRIEVPGNGELRAAVLNIDDTLKRWVAEQGLSESARAQLFSNSLFRAAADKLATSLDTLAAVRIAEWVEQYPEVTDLVIDTAPGIHAVDFVAKPEKVMAFIDSKFIEWMRFFIGEQKGTGAAPLSLVQRIVKGGARKVLDGLAQLGGNAFLINFGEFLILLDTVFLRMMVRLEYARAWMRDPHATNVVLVSSVRDDAVHVARELTETLAGLHLRPRLSVMNRTVPPALLTDSAMEAFLEAASEIGTTRQLFGNYVSGYIQTQRRVLALLHSFADDCIEIPVAANLDAGGEIRQADLIQLGENLISHAGTAFG